MRDCTQEDPSLIPVGKPNHSYSDPRLPLKAVLGLWPVIVVLRCSIFGRGGRLQSDKPQADDSAALTTKVLHTEAVNRGDPVWARR